MAKKKTARGTKRRTGVTELPRRRRKKVETQLAFDAIVIEGGILSPEWLARAAQQEAPDQSPDSYRVPKGLELRDEVGRYWRIAQAKWKEVEAARDKAEGDAATAKAAATRFVVGLLRDCFGFGTLTEVDPVDKDDRVYPIGHAALGGRVPVVVAPLGAGVDGQEARSAELGDGTRKRNAFGLTQEYLNAEDKALWGLCSDGLTLRLLRDNASLTRPAWMAADLERIFTEERFADFTALWLILHETRFGSGEHAPSECALEKWREAGREEGTRARDQLRHGVEEALRILGQGFIDHPDNEALRASLHDGSLTKEVYFQELLRTVYRLIFLLTAEERGVLHPPGVPEATKKLYAEGYGLFRLRDRAVKRSSHDRFHDGWEGVKVVFAGLDRGEPAIGLPALLGLFAKEQCRHLDQAKLHNRAFFPALFRLSWLREDGGLARVNWRDMGPEELGSVYESLLELVPQLTEQGRKFGFATGAETAGNERKQTGSYYTPDSLVQCLLDSALDPVVDRAVAENPGREVEALLELTVVDPACGSGHFLLAAARRIADRIAKIEADGTPSAEEYRHALRRVVSRCVYGVDLNPMAVELCKVGLWMEAVEPGRPLSFLDAHVQHGNALLGTTPELMDGGIPDDAWKPIEGDDNEIAKALKKRNKAEAKQDVLTLRGDAEKLRTQAAELEAKEDEDVESLNEKARAWSELVASEPYRNEKLVADAWCAAFVWPKTEEAPIEAAPTNGVWRQLRLGRELAPDGLIDIVESLLEEYNFFHWHLVFPHVWQSGGFDVVLGNPPWGRLKLEDREWFAVRAPEIAFAANASIRRRLIARLETSDPLLAREYRGAHRVSDGTASFLRASSSLELTSSGDLDTYPLFSERSTQIQKVSGRVGIVVPTGIATDLGTSRFFSSLLKHRRVVSLLDFKNTQRRFFPSVEPNKKFSLLTVAGQESDEACVFAFFLESTIELAEEGRLLRMDFDDVSRLNPNSYTVPVVRNGIDLTVLRELHDSTPPLVLASGSDELSPWDVLMTTVFHMSGDSSCFVARERVDFAGSECALLPLYEGKMFHLYDNRYTTFEGLSVEERSRVKAPARSVKESEKHDPEYLPEPRYWVEARELEQRFGKKWSSEWIMAFRDVTNTTTNRRTTVVSALPRVATNHKAPLILPRRGRPECFLATVSSLVFDYSVRQRLNSNSLTFFVLKQAPAPPPDQFESPVPWATEASLADWIRPRVLELVYTNAAMLPFARQLGFDGPPFGWDTERRRWLMAELDGAIAELYSISRPSLVHILSSFTILRDLEVAHFGDFRSALMVLDVFDRIQDAKHTGTRYRTNVSPPPASPQLTNSAALTDGPT